MGLGRQRMKYIFKTFSFGTLDYKDAERLLNNMAAKGYEFKGTGKGWIRNIAMFEKNAKAQHFKYAIDVAKRKEYEKEKYYQFYKDLGWEKIDCLNKRIYIFATEKDNSVPIYTDKVSETNMLKKAVINNGELLDNIIQLVCMIFVSSVLFFRRAEMDNLIGYSFIIFYCLIMGYYAVQVAVKLLYSVMGWKYEKQYFESKILQIIRWCSKLSWIAFLIYLPIVSIIGTWTNNVLSSSFFGIIRWQSVQLLLCIGSIPVILTGTYFLFLYPEKERFKIIINIGVTMYFLGLWCFLSYIL